MSPWGEMTTEGGVWKEGGGGGGVDWASAC